MERCTDVVYITETLLTVIGKSVLLRFRPCSIMMQGQGGGAAMVVPMLLAVIRVHRMLATAPFWASHSWPKVEVLGWTEFPCYDILAFSALFFKHLAHNRKPNVVPKHVNFPPVLGFIFLYLNTFFKSAVDSPTPLWTQQDWTQNSPSFPPHHLKCKASLKDCYCDWKNEKGWLSCSFCCSVFLKYKLCKAEKMLMLALPEHSHSKDYFQYKSFFLWLSIKNISSLVLQVLIDNNIAGSY